ncbi:MULTISPECIES: aspartyl-phosphate phosphatase Spo0E family protein [Metabacillus]|uniref:aspartyl-phosphate phosphatase Spo0E family protein n=1 Tax=Metabacillus TaxID=2675233 RepID=UPI0022B4263E|nr:aspartyl-phosphate phosphatase Spo0E family protein [Metabacillus litoralis]
MNNDSLKTKLLETINIKRKEMIETATKEGYTSELAVQCSQDLDLLLNEYQQMLIEEKKPKVAPFQDLVHSMKLFTYTDRYSY